MKQCFDELLLNFIGISYICCLDSVTSQILFFYCGHGDPSKLVTQHGLDCHFITIKSAALDK